MAGRRRSKVAREQPKCRVCGITEPCMPSVLGLPEESGDYCQQHYREYMDKVMADMQAAVKRRDALLTSEARARLRREGLTDALIDGMTEGDLRRHLELL